MLFDIIADNSTLVLHSWSYYLCLLHTETSGETSSFKKSCGWNPGESLNRYIFWLCFKANFFIRFTLLKAWKIYFTLQFPSYLFTMGYTLYPMTWALLLILFFSFNLIWGSPWSYFYLLWCPVLFLLWVSLQSVLFLFPSIIFALISQL